MIMMHDARLGAARACAVARSQQSSARSASHMPVSSEV